MQSTIAAGHAGLTSVCTTHRTIGQADPGARAGLLLWSPRAYHAQAVLARSLRGRGHGIEKHVAGGGLGVMAVNPLKWSSHASDEDGQGLVEYALILVLIAVVAILALAFLGSNLSTILSTVGNSI